AWDVSASYNVGTAYSSRLECLVIDVRGRSIVREKTILGKPLESKVGGRTSASNFQSYGSQPWSQFESWVLALL
ncbi:MAG: hypothetical protein ACI9K5_003079, partial [Gammaproteobacteria bacterium]